MPGTQPHTQDGLAQTAAEPHVRRDISPVGDKSVIMTDPAQAYARGQDLHGIDAPALPLHSRQVGSCEDPDWRANVQSIVDGPIVSIPHHFRRRDGLRRGDCRSSEQQQQCGEEPHSPSWVRTNVYSSAVS